MGWVDNATPAIDNASQYPTIVAICIVLSILSIATVSCRLWIRAAARGLASDDWMAALSMIFALAYSMLCIVQTKYGFGLPLRLRPEANLIPYTRVNFAGRPIYQLGISFFKIALLISYLRLLSGTDQRIYRLVVCITIALVFFAHLGSALSLIFAYSPIHKSLKVRLEKKLGLVGIFMLGLFTTLCSILRYIQIDRIQFGDGNSTMLILWGTIEFNVGNMVSSLPFLAPVCMRKAKDYRSKYSAGSGHGGHDEVSGAASSHRAQRSRGRHNSEHYRLADVSNDKSVFRYPKSRSASEEHILQTNHHTIVKSGTYTVQVDEEAAAAAAAAAAADDYDDDDKESSLRSHHHDEHGLYSV